MRRAFIVFLAFATGLTSQPMPLTPAASVPRGEDVLYRVNARPRGKASLMHLDMIIHDARRGEFHKTIVMQRKRFGSGYRTVYRITTPDHEKGIGLLISEDDNQRGIWMYFPATKQVIPVVSRGFPAMASDFNCEDMLVGVPLADYEFRVLGKDLLEGHEAVKVEMKPRTERLRSELGFFKSIGWVREDLSMIVRADYYDDAGALFKTFRAGNIERRQGIWTAKKIEMENFRAHHASEVRVLDTDYSIRFTDAPFTPNRMVPGVDPPT
jgi:hypothetical protein